MKKVLAIILVLAMILSFAACGEKKEEGKKEEQKAAWPNGPITLYAGYSASSKTATNIVTMQEWLQQKTGVTVEIEWDDLGGGANLAAQLAKSEPDGQTIMLFGVNCINNYINGEWAVDPTDSSVFRAVASTPQPWPYSGCMVLTQKDAPFDDFESLKAYVESHVGEVTAASIPGKVMDPKLKSFLIQTGLSDKVRWVSTDAAGGDQGLLNGDINLVMSDEFSALKFLNNADFPCKAIINLRPDDDFSYYDPNTAGLDTIKSIPTLTTVFGSEMAEQINLPNTSCWVVPAGTPDEICELITAAFDAIDAEPESTDDTSFYKRVRANGGTSKYWVLEYDEIVSEYARIKPILQQISEMNANVK